MGTFEHRAAGLVAGYAADLAFGDPRHMHPVAGFGRAAQLLESATYRNNRRAGCLYALILIGSSAAAASGARRAPAIALTGWAAFGGTSLLQTALKMARHLEADDLDAARALLPSLCGRDPNSLDREGLARAALESVAENTSDAAVAPMLWGAVAGAGGIAGYRAANTLDAMVGYRNRKYERFGWAAARIDDVLNYVPARWCGVLIVVAAPVVGGSPREALTAWRRDANKHPSPNAGVVEAAMAGALGVHLGGTTVYPHGVQERPILGSGAAPTVGDLERAVKLSAAVQAAAVLGSAALAVAVGHLVGRLRLSRGRNRGR